MLYITRYKGKYFNIESRIGNNNMELITCSAEDVLRTLTLYTSIHAPKKQKFQQFCKRNIIVRSTGM